tara:strand:+ start:862 stop:1185 length:324 start_codon:yes stop_codon:yes gene_type:complete
MTHSDALTVVTSTNPYLAEGYTLWTHQCIATADSGTVTGTATVDGSNDDSFGSGSWNTVCTFSISGTTPQYASPTPAAAYSSWKWLRYSVSAISGTNAKLKFVSVGN